MGDKKSENSIFLFDGYKNTEDFANKEACTGVNKLGGDESRT